MPAYKYHHTFSLPWIIQTNDFSSIYELQACRTALSPLHIRIQISRAVRKIGACGGCVRERGHRAQFRELTFYSTTTARISKTNPHIIPRCHLPGSYTRPITRKGYGITYQAPESSASASGSPASASASRPGKTRSRPSRPAHWATIPRSRPPAPPTRGTEPGSLRDCFRATGRAATSVVTASRGRERGSASAGQAAGAGPRSAARPAPSAAARASARMWACCRRWRQRTRAPHCYCCCWRAWCWGRRFALVAGGSCWGGGSMWEGQSGRLLLMRFLES